MLCVHVHLNVQYATVKCVHMYVSYRTFGSGIHQLAMEDSVSTNCLSQAIVARRVGRACPCEYIIQSYLQAFTLVHFAWMLGL